MVTLTNEFRHGSASAPEHAGKRVPPLLPLRVRPRTIASHSRFVCAGFLFSEWAIGSRVGFSLKGETDGIQTTVLPTFLLYSNIIIRLGHSFGLVVVYHFAFT